MTPSLTQGPPLLAHASLIFASWQEAYNNGTGGERSEALEEINRLGSGALGTCRAVCFLQVSDGIFWVQVVDWDQVPCFTT